MITGVLYKTARAVHTIIKDHKTNDDGGKPNEKTTVYSHCRVSGSGSDWIVSVYATDKGKERREAEQEIAAQTQQEAPASYEVKPEISVEDATKKRKNRR